MKGERSQDKLMVFRGALEKKILDWKTFVQLYDDREDALQLMLDKRILSIEKEGNYEVQSGIRGINSPAANLKYGQEMTPLYFTDKKYAMQVVDFYKENRQKVKITEY